MPQHVPTLLQLARAGFEAAKRHDARRTHLRLLVLGLGAFGLIQDGLLSYAAAVAALASESLAWWLGHVASRLHGLAEAAKRRALLTDALGEQGEPRDIRDLRSRFSTELTASALRCDDREYYTSGAPAGTGRLAEHIEESAFWSWHLYRAAAKRVLLLACGIAVLVLMAALVALPMTTDSAGLLIARSLILVLGSVVAADSLGVGLRWMSASNRCHQVLLRVPSVDLSDTEQCLALVCDYSVAVAVADPIPSALYFAQRTRLNELWAHHRSQ